jgi:uncharacterized membrane protein YhaH (DUF805 family)
MPEKAQLGGAENDEGAFMDFMTAVKTCFAKYATFAGRAPRSEFWYFILFMVLGSLVFGLLDKALFPAMEWSPLGAIFSLVTLLPSLAVTARRLHDIDKSGWWQLIVSIPFVGIIILIIWMCKPGTPGTNRFGEMPLAYTAPAIQGG